MAHEFSIFKSEDEKRLVFGWASVAVMPDGAVLEDRQKDVIDPDDLEEAAYSYVLEFRDTGEEHIPSLRKKGRLVESCVLTEEKQKAMGIPAGTVPVGWWIGFKIEDDEAWEKVKNGTYKMFSIEGKATRIPVEKSGLTGCGVLVLRDGKILTGTRQDTGEIGGPGGHIEEGETPEEAAAREAMEEFGIRCQSLSPIGTVDGNSAVFLCEEYEGDPKADGKEMADAKWRTVEELGGKSLFTPFAHSLPLLEEHFSKKKKCVAKTFHDVMGAAVRYFRTTEEHTPSSRFDFVQDVTKGNRFDEIVEVVKFNPFHDAKGRFASSNSFSSYSANPNTRAGAMAISRSAAAGHGNTQNVHRQSYGENINQNANWIGNNAANYNQTTSSTMLRNRMENTRGLAGASNFGALMQSVNQATGRNTTNGKNQPANQNTQQKKPTNAKPQQQPKPQQQQPKPETPKQNGEKLADKVKDVTLESRTKLGVQPRDNNGHIVAETTKIAGDHYQDRVSGKDISKNLDLQTVSGNKSAIDKVVELQGWNKNPTVTNDFEAFQKAAQKSGQLLIRTVNPNSGEKLSAEDVTKQIMTNGNTPLNGTGAQAYGGGLYLVGSDVSKPKTAKAMSNDVFYSQNHSFAYGHGESVQMMATVHPGAKIATASESNRMRDEFRGWSSAQKEKFGNDFGAYIASKGYDGAQWHDRKDPYITMYNKSAMVFYGGVVKEQP